MIQATEHKSILQSPYHDRLLQNITQVCRTAGVPVGMVHKSMADAGCSKLEQDWVIGFFNHADKGHGGLCMAGVGNAVQRMMGMAAGLLRNYVDARVVAVESAIESYRNEENWNPRALFIPNFCIGVSHKNETLREWQMQVLYSLLLDRFTQGRQTVIYVGAKNNAGTGMLIEAYGEVFADFIKNHWIIYEG